MYLTCGVQLSETEINKVLIGALRFLNNKNMYMYYFFYLSK